MTWDVVIVGGGAAGLLAAWRAATLGATVLVLEKNRRPGVKILASGGGRCNLTTTRRGPSLEASFSEPQRRFLRAALRAWTPFDLRSFFAERGVPTREEEFEKVFPVAGKASVILDALVRATAAAGVRIETGQPVLDVARADEGFLVTTSLGQVCASRVILAPGGQSYPKAGTTGDGYGFATRLGLEVTRRFPALVGLVIEDPRIAGLQGISVKSTLVHLLDGERRVLTSDRPLLFTHRGLSGPGPMNLAGDIEIRGGGVLELDFWPAQQFDALDRALADAARNSPRHRTAHLLPAPLPERLRDVLCRVAGVSEDVRGGSLARLERRALVHAIKSLRLVASGTLGFDRAEVTRGGVVLDEVHPRTMESRRVRGLHVAGELLDVDGPIGGFNFQAAFATGYAAGESAARSLKA